MDIVFCEVFSWPCYLVVVCICGLFFYFFIVDYCETYKIMKSS